MGGFNIPFLADVRPFLKGTDNMADSLEDVSDALEHLGKNKATDKLEDGLKDAGKEARTFETKVKDAFDGISKEARDSGKTIGKSVKDGTEKAGEGLSELKDESKSTAKEAAASFSSIEDAADALQEVAANAFAGFGPAGVAAGIAAAAGIGVAIAGLQNAADEANAAGERVGTLGQEFKDAGGKWDEAGLTKRMEDYGFAVQDTKEWWEVWQNQAQTGFEKVALAASDAKVPLKNVFSGMFGPGEKSVALLAEIDAQIAAVTRSETRYSGALDENYQQVSYITDAGEKQLKGLRDLREQAQKNSDEQTRLVKQENVRRQSIDGTTQALRENLTAQEKVTDAQKGALTSSLDLIDKQESLTAQLAESGNAWDTNTKAGRDNQRAVIDIASGIEDVARAAIDAGQPIDAVTGKFQAQRAALVDQVLPAFQGNRQAAEDYIASILKTPTAKTTTVTLAGVADAEAQLRAFINQPRTIPMHISPDGSAVENYIEGMNGRKVYVDIAPRGGVGITN